jgi:hypothetical protein
MRWGVGVEDVMGGGERQSGRQMSAGGGRVVSGGGKWYIGGGVGGKRF